MSLRIDYQELKESFRAALITEEKHFFSNGTLDVNVFVKELNLEGMSVDVEIKSIGKPPTEAYELVPPPKTLDATDVNIHLQIALKAELPQQGSKKASLDISGSIHKPVYNFAAVQSQIDVDSVKFGCLMNVALVNGHIVVWASDILLEPVFGIIGSDEFLTSYLVESMKKFLTLHFSRMQHIFSI